jgi:ubiquinone/menaquinone biosynthesis C-methylase UbiE
VSDPYRFSARFYDRLFESMNNGLRVLGLRLYLPKSGAAILDVGCGTGSHLALYQRYQARLAGIDASPAMLDLARKRLGEHANLQLGDAAEMPFADGSFDLVLAMLSLHEMDPSSRGRVLNQMVRVSKPAGRLLLIDYHPGRLEFPQGWWTKAIILLSELAAGREHFRNFRRYMRAGGLPAMIERSGLSIEKQRIVGGGPLSLFLVSNGAASQRG